MKVLHIIHCLDLRSGGPSHALFELSKVQVAAGVNTSIIATDRQAGASWLPKNEFENSLNTLLPGNVSNFLLIPSYGKTRPWIRFAYSPYCKNILTKYFETSETKPDFVHIHGLFSHITYLAAKLSKKFNIPYAVRPTGALDPIPLTMGFSLLKKTAIRCLVNPMIKDASFLHATSEAEAKSLEKYCNPQQIKTIPLGVTSPNISAEEAQKIFFEKFQFLKDKKFIFSLSRIHHKKNLQLTLRAFQLITKIDSQTLLVIAGEKTPYQDKLEKLAENLGIKDRLHFIGFISGGLKSGAFYAAKCFIQTSRHENFGITVMEALAHGLKVVSTPGVATSKQVIESNGGLVVSDLKESVSNALKKLLEDAKSNKNQQLATWTEDQYSWKATAGKLNKIYQLCTTSKPAQ